MLIYVTLSLGNIPQKKGKPTWLIGICGIIIVAASAIVGYGGTAYLGVKSSMISLEVIPFLILAIGVDNMFIIAQAVGREEDTETHVRVGKAIAECTPSIVVACVTELVTFAVGISTNIPALKVFCMTAVFAILANFVLQMTAFVAILSYDINRTLRIGDYFTPDEETKSGGKIAKCFSTVFTPIATSRVTAVFVFLISLGMVGLAIPFFNNMKLGIDQQITVRTDGVLYNVE
jgi:Niemann-Pick C1 protein